MHYTLPSASDIIKAWHENGQDVTLTAEALGIDDDRVRGTLQVAEEVKASCENEEELAGRQQRKARERRQLGSNRDSGSL
jgi:predicted lipid-binding transport protein (Tim44 family)